MVSQCMKGEKNVKSGHAEARGEVRAQVGWGSSGRRQSDTVKSRGKEREREEVVAEEREGKMRTEHFKLTQNSIVKDKSRGRIQLKGMSPTFQHLLKDNIAFQACTERGLDIHSTDSQDTTGLSAERHFQQH